MRSRTIYGVLALMVGFVCQLHLVNAAGREVSARSLCLERVTGPAKVFVEGEGKRRDVFLPTENFSSSFPCALVDGSVTFYQDDGVDDKGKPKRLVVAKAGVPASFKNILCYFLPAKKSDKYAYELLILEDSEASFPMGGVKMLNTAATKAVMAVGKSKPRLAKLRGFAKLKAVTSRDKDDFNNGDFVCKVQAKNGSWHTISEAKLKFTDRIRWFVVVYADKYSKGPAVKFYKDIKPYEFKVRK